MQYQDTVFGRNTGLPKAPGFSKAPPQGARVNDLSGQVPANQIWAKAYNQASQQQGGGSRAQSWTMPGSYSSQSYNPATGVYNRPTMGASWDGNMAYNAIDSRPSPVTAQATGVGGNQMNWQDSLRQRDAFVGNLVNRLNQYSSGQMTGRPTFDTTQLLSQANKQIADGTWQNPFAAPQQAQAPGRTPLSLMAPGGAEAPTPGHLTKPPSQWSEAEWASYEEPYKTGHLKYLVHTPRYYRDDQGRARYYTGAHMPTPDDPVDQDGDAAWNRGRLNQSNSGQGAGRPFAQQNTDVQNAMGNAAQYMQGGFQNPFGSSWQANNPMPSLWQAQYDPTPSEAAQPSPAVLATPGSAQPIQERSVGEPYNPQAQAPSRPPPPVYRARLQLPSSRRAAAQGDGDTPAADAETESPQAKAQQAKLKQLDAEINKWERATYGTWKGSGPPASNFQQIRTLRQLRDKAAAGDPAALAWQPRTPAPPPAPMRFVPPSRRGYGGMRSNGDVR